jgi:anti-sigma factor RsiW
MSCETHDQTLALHAGGDLPPDQAIALRAHLDGCPRCRQVLAELGAAGDWLHRQRLTPVAAPLLDELQRRIAAQLPGRRPAPWLLAWWGRLRERTAASRMALERPAWTLAGSPLLAVVGALLLVVGVAGALDGSRDRAASLAAGADGGQPGVASAPSPGDPALRIEMQTGDPNVRIIWFASAEPGRR